MKLVLLGDPVAHSRSPAIHNAALAACGVEGEYVAIRADATGVGRAFAGLAAGTVDGANVTMPHKLLAARLCDDLDDAAGRCGAVNTLVAQAGKVRGHNTDVVGIITAWGEAGLPVEAPVLLLGAGGAAAAALLALEGRRIRVVARRPERAAALVERLGVAAEIGRWGTPWPGAVVVNSTPLGMKSEELPEGTLDHAAGLFDMAYGDVPTPAMTRAVAACLPAASGLDMLVAQAARSFELWTGLTAPVEAMRDAARG